MSKTTTTTTMTPYAAAKLANAYLAEQGIDKVLPPQMFYTYVKKGYIASIEGKVTPEALADWLTKYAAKHAVVELDEQAQFDAAEAV